MKCLITLSIYVMLYYLVFALQLKKQSGRRYHFAGSLHPVHRRDGEPDLLIGSFDRFWNVFLADKNKNNFATNRKPPDGRCVSPVSLDPDSHFDPTIDSPSFLMARHASSRSSPPASNSSRRKRRSASRSPRRRDDSGSRSRSRSPSRRSDDRLKDRDRHRNSDSYRSYKSQTSRKRDEEKSELDEIVSESGMIDMDEQHRRLELIMQRRRERVEKWRREQAEKRAGSTGSTGQQQEKGSDSVDLKEEADDKKTENGTENEEKKKQWTLDDEFDEGDDDEEQDMEIDEEESDGRELQLPKKPIEEEDEDKVVQTSEAAHSEPANVELSKQKHEPDPVQQKQQNNEDDEELDPLDAYMTGIQQQVKQLRGKQVKEQAVGQKTKLVVGVVKKKTATNSKGELLEEDPDALAYSSEEETTTQEDLMSMSSSLSQSKLKKVTAVTLEDISYRPFRKNFYIEVPELASMTPEQVEEYRNTFEGIRVKGKNCPKPIRSWAHAGVSRKMLELLKKYGYEKPTPIQAQAIPAIMSGRDVIGIAKTGSGKTLAFLIPMFRHILDQDPLEPGDGPIGVIMTPTRELATQIWSECKKFAKPLGLRVVAVYGGTPISEQIGELKPGAEVVVCTPGRMIDMLAANNGRVTNLRRCTYVVLDEADRMFDLGFEPQVTSILERIRPDRQNVMFSATFPRIMEALARRILDKPIEVLVGGRSVVAKEVEQNVLVISEEDKFLKLLQLLGLYMNDDRTAIVFVEKQESADYLLKELLVARYSCLALHGGIDQNDRDSIISDYKHQRVKVLVATSVAARGLDVRHCYLVVNYDAPNHYEDYVHRVGRTGRAGEHGVAWTFLTPTQGRFAGDIIKAFELADKVAPDEVKRLFEEYKQQQEAMGKKVRSGGGFRSGKGFKFDEAETQLANDKKKMQKAAFGLQDSDDEEENDIDAEIENMLSVKKNVKQIAKESVPVPSSATTTSQQQQHSQGSALLPTPLLQTSAASVMIPASNHLVTNDKLLEVTKRINAKLATGSSSLVPSASSSSSSSSQSSTNVPSLSTSSAATTAAFLKGESMSESNVLHRKAIAEQRAERLQAKLNYVPRDIEYNEDGEFVRTNDFTTTSTSIPTTGETFQRFEEELEINDFPQQARWRVTSREALAQISEYSDAGLTVRGTYYAPGAKVPDGERKLYLAIEGTSELAVSKARLEITRLIKEELIRLQNSSQPNQNKSRYRVL